MLQFLEQFVNVGKIKTAYNVGLNGFIVNIFVACLNSSLF